jgi:hypothetical protein
MLVAGWRVAGYGVDQMDKNHDGKWVEGRCGLEKNTAILSRELRDQQNREQSR